MLLDTPTNFVLSMRAQGLSNNQIIQSLQRESYNSQQIADAMAQADIKYSAEGQQPSDSYNYPYPQEQPSMPSEQQYSQNYGISAETIQPLVEAIIEEKWEELVKNVSKLAEWRDSVEQRLSVVEDQAKSLKDSFDKLHTSLLEKLGEYDQTMSSVGTDVKAMEQAFKKILPGFLENVAELSRITDDMKKAKK